MCVVLKWPGREVEGARLGVRRVEYALAIVFMTYSKPLPLTVLTLLLL